MQTIAHIKLSPETNPIETHIIWIEIKKSTTMSVITVKNNPCIILDAINPIVLTIAAIAPMQTPTAAAITAHHKVLSVVRSSNIK